MRLAYTARVPPMYLVCTSHAPPLLPVGMAQAVGRQPPLVVLSHSGGHHVPHGFLARLGVSAVSG
jgi:hypothetical protein